MVHSPLNDAHWSAQGWKTYIGCAGMARVPVTSAGCTGRVGDGGMSGAFGRFKTFEVDPSQCDGLQGHALAGAFCTLFEYKRFMKNNPIGLSALPFVGMDGSDL